jgi:hypothetical protein
MAHCLFIDYVRRNCDASVGILSSDNDITFTEGPQKPILPLKYRAAQLKDLRVDTVTFGKLGWRDLMFALPHPVFVLRANLLDRQFSWRIEAENASTVRLEATDYFTDPGIPGVMDTGFSFLFRYEELEHFEMFLHRHPEVEYFYRKMQQTVGFRGYYFVTEGDPRTPIKRLVATLSGFELIEVPNRLPTVHSTEIINKFNVQKFRGWEKGSDGE